jgi:glycerol uptake operon antiterminator
MLPDQTVIPVITSMKALLRFLETPLPCFIAQDFHLNLLGEVIETAHAHKRSVIVHIELIQGLASDEYGTQHIIQHLHADAIISSKPKVIEMAKKNKTPAILRLFVMDSKSLKRGIELTQTLIPDAVEFMPSLVYPLIVPMIEAAPCEVWAGGLIRTLEMIHTLTQAGITRVTVSDLSLATAFHP